MSQDWIDVPALVRRDELAAGPVPERRPTRNDPSQPPEPTLLSGYELRDLIERRYTLEHQIRNHDSRQRDYPRHLRGESEQRDRIAERLTDTKTLAARSQETLDTYDRPLHRHGHKHDIAGARADLKNCERRIPDLETELAAQTAKIDTIKTNMIELDTQRSTRVGWQRELGPVYDKLNHDLDQRARRHSTEHDPDIGHDLGARPTNPKTAAIWDQTAARYSQHRDAYPTGHGHNPAASDNRHRARGAHEQLNRALEHDNPHQRDRGMGISR